MTIFSRMTIQRAFGLLLVSPLIAGCSVTMNQNSLIESVVQVTPLANGKGLNVGYKHPSAAAQCKLVRESSQNWAVAETRGQFKMGRGRQVLQEEAVDAVNARPQDGINYVALTIPNASSLATINLTASRDATTSYYRCETPPHPR